MTLFAIFTLLSAVGATFIVTKSWLFETIRNWFLHSETLFTLISCPQCLGFWVGLLSGIAMIPLLPELSGYAIFFVCLGLAFSTSGVCFIINEMLEK